MTHELYTDGACSGNPGPGGWAAVLSLDGQWLWHAGREERTTNNRMEMLAAIRGLEQVPPGGEVVVYSDSQYLVNTMTKGWQRRLNQDLWAKLDALGRTRVVSWRWVPGHAGYPLNEEANRLAQAAASDRAWGPERSGALGVGREGTLPELVEGRSPDVPSTSSGNVGTSAQSKRAVGIPPHLSHLDAGGRARMVDVSEKAETEREAVAAVLVQMQRSTLELIRGGAVAKGDVFTVAQIAGVMAAKKTSDLIPLCHPLPLTHVSLDFRVDDIAPAVEITATARTTGKTGVEMEALTAASVAALTIYDMCKAVDRGMRITDLRLTRKSGGKSGTFQQE